MNEEMMQDLERDSGLYDLEENQGLITMEKLTEFRYFFEQHQEGIPPTEYLNYPEEVEYRVNLDNLKKEMDKIQLMINSNAVEYNQFADICLADFMIMFGEALQNKEPQSKEPFYMTDIEFAQIISAAEMKIYQGEPIMEQISKN